MNGNINWENSAQILLKTNVSEIWYSVLIPSILYKETIWNNALFLFKMSELNFFFDMMNSKAFKYNWPIISYIMILYLLPVSYQKVDHQLTLNTVTNKKSHACLECRIQAATNGSNDFSFHMRSSEETEEPYRLKGIVYILLFITLV